MPMRPSALLALLLVAAVGCGVPETPVVADKTPPQEATKPKANEPAKPSGDVKPAEQDPTKLGEKIVDTKVGVGPVAETGDTCVMKYAGRLKSNNQEFDSNMKGDKPPFSFVLGSGQVIKGWDLGVKGMKVGGKRTLEIPPDLAYGAEDKDKIPGNSTLVFDIELVDVQKAADAATVVREPLAPGTGPEAKDGDVVTIKYKGMLVDGTVVDDNKGKTAQFKVGSPEVTIPGLNLALRGMRKGQKVRAKIPAALGYQGPPAGPMKPNTAMVFEIELVKIG